MEEISNINRVGGFFAWSFGMLVTGFNGTLYYDSQTVKWKSFLGLAGKFEHTKNELSEIIMGKFINWIVFPSKCYVFKFSNGKQYKLKPVMSFGEDKEKWDLFLKAYADKCKF